MSILASLVRAYDRLPNAPPFGFSSEKIGFLISLNDDGSVAHVVDLRHGEGKKKTPRMMLVPQPVKRTAGITPNFLWDKTSYVLGVTAAEGKRTADEHAAFVKRHVDMLEAAEDAGLRAFGLFLRNWTADKFVAPIWPDEMKDQNVIFALESERRNDVMLHDRQAAKMLWARLAAEVDSTRRSTVFWCATAATGCRSAMRRRCSGRIRRTLRGPKLPSIGEPGCSTALLPRFPMTKRRPRKSR